MDTEEKDLLLKDLCARLPYGVILDIDTTDWIAPQGHITLKIEGIGMLFKDMSLIVNGSYYGDKYKPYLRPMSSMTEEEWDNFNNYRGVDGVLMPIANELDWLNKHHFDYRGLIEKGLALEASEGMYNETDTEKI